MLRPFTDSDWAAFSGCESEWPLIAHTESGSFVLDGRFITVCLNRLPEEEAGPQDIFTGDFAGVQEAKRFLEFLIVNPGVTPRVLDHVGES